VNVTAVKTLRIQRWFLALPAEVFDAWTSPEVLRRWWSAYPGWKPSVCSVDLRVGGRFVLGMRDGDGREHVVEGEYRQVQRPALLRYTWCWQNDELHPGHTSLVTVRFDPDRGGTTVVLEHSGLASDRSMTRHRDGWNGTLTSLAHTVFPDPSTRGGDDK
jgi:uncharacterized protein YndB with AHSA1/START domain